MAEKNRLCEFLFASSQQRCLEMRIFMKDIAQSNMSLGKSMSAAYISSVNDNMSQLHYHDYYELYFLDNGERYHYMDEKLYKTQTGDCIIFPPQTMHRSFSNKDCSFSRIVLYFRPEIIISENLKNKLIHSDCVYTPDKNTLKNLRRFIYLFLESENNPSELKFEYMSSLTNLILTLVVQMKQKKTGIIQQNRTTQIIDYINNNYDHDICLHDLAEKFHVSEYYLCREFKKNTNRTIIDYIKRTRIMNAERFFIETDMNVTKVSTLTGFSNLTHFYRVFKEITGYSPSEYRKHLKKINLNKL